MAERVSTGGTKSFEYKKGYDPKLTKTQKQEIDRAYALANERKRKEKKKRNLIIITIIILVLIIILAATLL
jgi:uncharacterized membrane protein YvbJ